MKRIEALALAICKCSGGFDPDDTAFKLCNPGRLRVFSPRLVPTMSEAGLRSFASWLDGLRALVFDLQVKCSGMSRTHLKPDARVEDLFGMWGNENPRKAITFMQRALGDESITSETAVGWFLEDK